MWVTFNTHKLMLPPTMAEFTKLCSPKLEIAHRLTGLLDFIYFFNIYLFISVLLFICLFVCFESSLHHSGSFLAVHGLSSYSMSFSSYSMAS